MKKTQKAFTLIELLVVIAIIGLLASITLVALNNARAKGKEAQRRANMKSVQTALELYYSDNNAYPSTAGSYWSDAPSYGGYGYTGAGGYISNLAPTYIAQLPKDPNFGKPGAAAAGSNVGCTGSSAGFIYRSDGANYKLLAHCLIDVAPPTSDPFYDAQRPNWSIQVNSNGAATAAW